MTNSFLTSGLFGRLFCDPEIATEFGAAAFSERMLAFEAAWTRALGATSAVPMQDVEQAVKAITAFSGVGLGAGSDRDGLPVPALVAALKAGLPEGSAAAIHSGATSQDVIDTAMVMTCLAVLDVLTGRMARLLTGLDELLEKVGDNPLVARTRMQVAMPATVALRVDAWRRPLVGHLSRSVALRADLSEVQIGGPIGSRETPNVAAKAVAQIVADALGLRLGPVWHNDRSRIVTFGHWMTLVAGSLGKIGQDIALMAQQGLDEVSIAGAGSSSAMAHKHNPVAAEATVTLARYVAGQQAILAQAMIHEQERSGAAWALEWMTLPAMAEATGAALRHAENLLASIERIGAPS